MGLSQLVGLLPSLAVWLVAGIVALVRWDKHPTASVLVLVAAGIGAMTRIASTVLPLALRERGMDLASMSWIFTALSIVGTAGMACLIAAVFVDRDDRTGPPRPPLR